MPLSFDRYRQLVVGDALLADETFSTIDPTTPVPSCPGWPASELRDHIAGVLVFWNRQLEVADPTAQDADFPPEVRNRYKLALPELAAEIDKRLREVGPDAPCWNWSGAPNVSSWVARRMANEVAMHRVDMQLAANPGNVSEMDSDLALDGIDELVETFAKATPEADLTGAAVLGLNLPEQTLTFAVSQDHGVRATDAPAHAALTGTPHQMLLALWGRPSSAESTGDPEVLNAWRRLPVFS